MDAVQYNVLVTNTSHPYRGHPMTTDSPETVLQIAAPINRRSSSPRMAHADFSNSPNPTTSARKNT
jgi:hypothetical protein